MGCPKCGNDNAQYHDTAKTTVKRAGKVGLGGVIGGGLGAPLGPIGVAAGILAGSAIGAKRGKRDKQYWECPYCGYFEFRD